MTSQVKRLDMEMKMKLQFYFILFFCQNNTFQKQCREERTLALASHVLTHTRKHKNSFTSATCCVHAHKEMSHCITRDENIRIREHHVFIRTQPSKVMPRHTSGSVKTWPVSIRPENNTLLVTGEKGLAKCLCSTTTDT